MERNYRVDIFLDLIPRNGKPWIFCEDFFLESYFIIHVFARMVHIILVFTYIVWYLAKYFWHEHIYLIENLIYKSKFP